MTLEQNDPIIEKCQNKYFELLRAERLKNPGKKMDINDHNRLKVQAGRETGDELVVKSINSFRLVNRLEPF